MQVEVHDDEAEEEDNGGEDDGPEREEVHSNVEYDAGESAGWRRRSEMPNQGAKAGWRFVSRVGMPIYGPDIRRDDAVIGY